MKAAVIITAAGSGKRMGGSTPKQFLEIAGVPILMSSIKKFEASRYVSQIVVVTQNNRIKKTEGLIEKFGITKNWVVVSGGKQRQDSVFNGIKALSDDIEIVAIHDAVRPFVETPMIDQSIETAAREGACIVAVPIKDTIKRGNETVGETLDRSRLWAAQTPQTFRLKPLKEAFEKAYKDGFYGTDEASLFERIGKKVVLLKGSYKNIKITEPDDLLMAEALARSEK